MLLFDEPLSNLDAQLRVQMRTEIRKIQKKLGITAIYVTHDQSEAMSMSDRIVVMKNGRIIQVGSPKEVYYHPRDLFVASFLGTANFLKGRSGAGKEIISMSASMARSCPMWNTAARARQAIRAHW